VLIEANLRATFHRSRGCSTQRRDLEMSPIVPKNARFRPAPAEMKNTPPKSSSLIDRTRSRWKAPLRAPSISTAALLHVKAQARALDESEAMLKEILHQADCIYFHSHARSRFNQLSFPLLRLNERGRRDRTGLRESVRTPEIHGTRTILPSLSATHRKLRARKESLCQWMAASGARKIGTEVVGAQRCF